MPGEATARKIVEALPAPQPEVLRFGGGRPPSASTEPAVSNGLLGLIAFLAAEVMFFAGLIGAFLVFRLGSPVWPPPFQPRLPVAVTGVNTLILVFSAVTVHWALRAIRAGNDRLLRRYLLATLFCGGLFLAIQGHEWVQLVRFGLTLSSGVYGATFYTLIGCHGAHVFGAVLWLAAVLVQAWRGRYSTQRHAGVRLCAVYWTFVVALWPVLYGLVYLY